MNVLFVLHGDFTTNSAVHLLVHARSLHRRGHRCAVAVPSGADGVHGDPDLRALLYGEALADPCGIFPDGKPADILHAWTPRERVRVFVTRYLAKLPTPWILYHEDNETWIAQAALSMVGLHEDVLLQHSEDVISTWTPDGLPHTLRHDSFIGLADAAVVIQDKLAVDIPPWVPWTAVKPGVDLAKFSPRPADPALRRRLGVADNERVLVYPGGLNDFTRPGLEALCRAVGLINRQGTPCRLLRSGPVALDFLDRLPPEAAAAVSDLGELPRDDLPDLLALADVLVQPGQPDPFEDLRLPGKLPEFFASGRPVVLPDTNIAYLMRDGVDAVLHRTGSPEEMAEKCLGVFADPDRARALGEAGRRFAETHFEPGAQAAALESAYRTTRDAFDARAARQLWSEDAEQVSVTALLARKLRILASKGGIAGTASPAMLETHARCLEFLLERSRGLETGMEIRDGQIGLLNREIAAREREIADLNGQLADFRASLSWRITLPFRMAGKIAARLLSRPRS